MSQKETTNLRSSNNNDEFVTLKDVILGAKDYIKELFRKWWVHVIFAAIGVAVSYYVYLQEETTYTAEISFMIQDASQQGSGGTLAALSERFGFDIGGGGGGAATNSSSKLTELLVSRKILEKTIFQKMNHNGNNDFIANHFIDVYNLSSAWAESPQLKDFKFKRATLDSFNYAENAALLTIYDVFVTNMLSVDVGISGIVHVNCTSNNELFSMILLERLTETLSKYYVNTSIGKFQENYKMNKRKMDSISTALRSAEYSLANARDKNRSLIKSKGYLEELRQQRNVSILSELYAESLAAMEISKIQLANNKPVIEVIDHPILPLKYEMPSKTKHFIIGILAGLFLSSIFIIFAKIIRDALAS